MAKYTIRIVDDPTASRVRHVLDRDSAVPLYHQLAEVIRSQIEDGEWGPGDMLPTEEQLAQDYRLSRGTVRQALEDLVREGLLVRERGRGTFVAEPKLEQSLMGLFSIFEYTKESGHSPGSRIVSFGTVNPERKVKEKLQLASGEKVYHIVRVRLFDDEPMMLDRVYIPVREGMNLRKDDIVNRSLYDILAKDYGWIITKAQQTFEPVLIDDYEAQFLNVEKGSPALLVRRVTLRASGAPVVFSKVTVRGDRCRFYVEIPGR